MNDIVERLREIYWSQDMKQRALRAEICGDAAAEIERLRAELARWVRQAEDNSGEAQRASLAVERLTTALQLTSGTLQQAVDQECIREHAIVTFTGDWSHLGEMSVADVLDCADLTLGAARESGKLPDMPPNIGSGNSPQT